MKKENYTSEDDSICPRDYKERTSPVLEEEKMKKWKENTLPVKGFTPQEHMEWAKEFDNLFGYEITEMRKEYKNYLSKPEDIKQFIQNQIKQAEERVTKQVREEIVGEIDDVIIEYQKEIVTSAEPFIPSDKNRYLIEKLNVLGEKIYKKLLN